MDLRWNPRDPFFFWAILATSFVAFAGFSTTYFGPMIRGAYPDVSTTVHMHGWTFFLWYLLAPLQSVLVRTGQVRIHRILGIAIIGLAFTMVFTGTVVATTQIYLARQPGGPPFWDLRGVAILATLIPFTVFFTLAIVRRQDVMEHKRLIFMASAIILGAAMSRIVAFLVGRGPVTGIIGNWSVLLFIVAGMVSDKIQRGKVHPCYKWGLVLGIVTKALGELLGRTRLGEPVKNVLSVLGEFLHQLYG